MAKGIRVNLLAKELGVESKAILAKLKDEGLADKAPNHMSTLPLGLAESVREWFHGHVDSDEIPALKDLVPREAKLKQREWKKDAKERVKQSQDDFELLLGHAKKPSWPAIAHSKTA